MPQLPTVRVRREGGRGHRLINKAKYDAHPEAYELVLDGQEMRAEVDAAMGEAGAGDDQDQGGPDAGDGADPVAVELLKAVRADYLEVVGKQAYHRWTVDELRERIAAAKASQG